MSIILVFGIMPLTSRFLSVTLITRRFTLLLLKREGVGSARMTWKKGQCVRAKQH